MSSERHALLAAICANADDDTPRLVFADWLDENGSAAWAELIRVGCELARLAADGSAAEAMFSFFQAQDEGSLTGVRWASVEPAIGRRIELSNRSAKLWRRAKSAAMASIPSVCGLEWGKASRRGFCSQATIKEPEKFLKTLPTLLKTCPPLTLTESGALNRVPGIHDRLLDAGLMRWTHGIDTSLDVNLATGCGKSADASRVRTFAHNRAGQDVVVSTLTSTPNWSGLENLLLGLYAPLDAALAVPIFGAKHLRTVRRLMIRGSDWTHHTIRDLNHFTNLTELHLRECGVGDDGAVLLANMPGLANLRSLSLHNNGITGRGATALLTSPRLANLGFLDLENNPVRGLDARPLANASPGGLRGVGFHGARLSVKDVGALVESPRLANLVYLDLDSNALADSAATRLVKGFGERAPAILYLMDNNFGNAAMRALTEWEAISGTHMLHLRGNAIDTPGAKILADCPHFRSISHICVSHVPLPGMNALRKRFGKKVRL